MLNRLECVGEAMRHALDALAVAAPEWLSGWIPSEWYERYRTRITDFQLPKGAAQRLAYGEQIGGDGVHLLQAVALPPAPAWLCDLPALVALRQIWAQQFVPDTPSTGCIRWRPEEALPPAAELIQSPHDLAARYSTKRATSWLGYKVHLTETCDDETPHLIVHVATTPATTHDTQALEPIHAELAAQNRLPATHLVDSGYVDADLLLSSRQTYRVDLVGPIQRDHSWQAKAEKGFDTASFGVDWAAHSVRCPQGQSSQIWKPTRTAQGEPVIHVAFHRRTCAACPARASCTRAATAGRELTLRPYAQHEAIAAARRYQDTQTFHERYAQRAGVEGTIAQGTRVCDLRRARYRGLAKTHLQHVLTAVAINALRITAWLQEEPRSKVHPSYFVRLARTA
jgi:transposase